MRCAAALASAFEEVAHVRYSRSGNFALSRRQNARADYVAGQPTTDEDDEAVQSRNAVPAVRERLDPEVELVVRSNGRGHATSIGFGRGPEVRNSFDAAAI